MAALSVLVEAGPLFEAAAAGLEQLAKKGALVTQVQITVHEPWKRYRVHPRQLESWLRTYNAEDNVSLRALKSRVRGILANKSDQMSDGPATKACSGQVGPRACLRSVRSH